MRRTPLILLTMLVVTPHGWYWNQVSAGGHSQQDCFVDFTGNGRTRCNMAGNFYVRLVMDRDAAATPAICSTS